MHSLAIQGMAHPSILRSLDKFFGLGNTICDKLSQLSLWPPLAGGPHVSLEHLGREGMSRRSSAKTARSMIKVHDGQNMCSGHKILLGEIDEFAPPPTLDFLINVRMCGKEHEYDPRGRSAIANLASDRRYGFFRLPYRSW
jgi:hypothetical protein